MRRSVALAVLLVACRTPASRLGDGPTAPPIVDGSRSTARAHLDASPPRDSGTEESSTVANPSTVGAASTIAEPRTGAVHLPRQLDFRTVSQRFDFRLLMDNECPGTAELDTWCGGPANLAIFPKGEPVAMQDLRLEAWLMSDPVAEAGASTPSLQASPGTIVVGDFNFDGQEDFAVQANTQGPYGGPTFAVFLFSPAKGQFVRSASLSKLTEETLGLFAVDTKRKRLITSSKSGCCWHMKEELAVVRNEPVAVFRLTEDATGLFQQGEDVPHRQEVIETTERLVNGKWQKHTRRVPLPD